MERSSLKQECIERMKRLEIHKFSIEDFEKYGQLHIHQRLEEFLILKTADGFILDKVREVEKKYGGMVYGIIETELEFGTCYSFLWTSKHTEEWYSDRKDLENNYLFAYVYNADNPEFSEFGSIVVKRINGKLIRIG